MKTILTLLGVVPLALATPLSAQQDPDGNPTEPGRDLIDLYERMQRDGTELQFRQLLHDKMRIEEFTEPQESGRPEDPTGQELTEEERFKLRVEKPWGPQETEMERRIWERLQHEMMAPRQAREVRQDHPEGPPQWFVGLVAEPVEPFVRAHFGLPPKSGLRVAMVMDDGPAAEAGIKVNDILVSANDRKVGTPENLKEAVLQAGREDLPVRLELIHRGERKTVTVKPRGPAKEERQESREGEPGRERRMMGSMEERLMTMGRLLEVQQQEIEKLRKQVDELRENSNPE